MFHQLILQERTYHRSWRRRFEPERHERARAQNYRWHVQRDPVHDAFPAEDGGRFDARGIVSGNLFNRTRRHLGSDGKRVDVRQTLGEYERRCKMVPLEVDLEKERKTQRKSPIGNDLHPRSQIFPDNEGLFLAHACWSQRSSIHMNRLP